MILSSPLRGALASGLLTFFTLIAHADLDEARLRVVATNYPLAYFAERLGGQRLKVIFPVPDSEDPAYWKPDAQAIGQMQRADLIVLNGAGYEKWLNRVSLPKLKQVDTSSGFKDAFIQIKDAVTHTHGPGGEHSHDGTAFTTWLDFEQAGKQAAALAHAIQRRRPELKSVVQENLDTLLAELGGIDAELKRLSSAWAKQPVLGSHPVYQYLARRYGLKMESVHWEPHEMPPESEWNALKKLLASHPARIMLWEAPPSPEIAARLKTLKVASVVFDPCANRPKTGDFLSVMRANIHHFASAP